jgi:hypothetical protein
MSTDVVLATHSDGVLRCYHRTADGALSQTAQIVAAASIEPTALATFVGDLSELFDWHGAVSALPQNGNGRTAAAPAIERSATADLAKRSELLDVIREHPDETSATIGTLLLGQAATPHRRDNIRKRLERAVQLGQVVRHRPNPGAHWRYRVASDSTAARIEQHVQQPRADYRQRPRASHAERERRRTAVLEYLQSHPESTAMEVGDAVFPAEPRIHRTGKARSVLEQLGAQHLVRRIEQPDEPIRFVAADEPEPEPESD